MKDRDVLIVGAGPTGLSAAFHLGPRAALVERERHVGGWCRSIRSGGFTFDMAGHIMFTNDPYVQGMYRLLLADNVHWQEREAWIYSHGVHTRYPFQGALYGLPPAVIQECLIGAIEARFGPLSDKPAQAPVNGAVKAKTNGIHLSNGNGSDPHGMKWHQSMAPAASAACPPGKLEDCCADGVLEAEAPMAAARGKEPKNFEEFIYQVWGAGIAKHFAIPYNRKLWAVPLDEMETSWLGGRVPLPDLAEMIQGALEPVPKPMGPNARFGYPLRGGFQALMDGFLPHLTSDLHLGTGVTRVSPARHEATLDDGSTIRYGALINTMPLPELIRRMGDEAPSAIRDTAQGLRHVSVRCVHLGIGRPNLTEKHWIYYPEDTVFHRIFVQGNASPFCNAPGGFGLTCEITYSEHKPLPCDGDALIERCIQDCRKVGMIGEDDPIWVACQVDLPYAYVVYDHERKRRVDAIRAWLAERDIVLAGRYSEWEYYNSDHAFIAGRKAAEAARAIVGEETRETRPLIESLGPGVPDRGR